jgi:hypothetical protein
MAKDRIDWTNPAELMHGDTLIPIRTPGQYKAVKDEVRRAYGTRVAEGELSHETLNFGKNELDQLVSRVRGGLTAEEIYLETEKELHRRAPLKAA